MFQNLKVYRVANDIKQEDLANLLSIGLNTYSNKENQKTSFTLMEAKKIADYFNVTIDELFFGDKISLKRTKL